MTAPTKENPHAVATAPREAKGATVGESSSQPVAAPIRGYAPPIIDTLPPASSGPVKLPRLWLAFHSDGKALYCTGTIQRASMERVRFDPSDPIVAQAYAFFVKQMVLMLGHGAPLAPAEPEPEAAPAPAVETEPAAPEAPALTPEQVPLAEVKTKREAHAPTVSAGGTTVLRRNQVQRLEAESDESVPPTNRTNPQPDRSK